MGRPKALLPFRGGTFLDSILQAIHSSSISHTVVVVGHHAREIAEAVAGPELIFNPDYERGMVTSFQAGLRAVPATAMGAMMFLVDHPLIESAVIETLIAEFSPGRIVLPVFNGRRGHPVLFSAEIFAEILELDASTGVNFVVRRDPARLKEVHLDNPGVLVDIDTPDEFDRLLEEDA